MKFKGFDRNNSFIDFNIFGDIFEDAETESAIVFHVRLIWVQNEVPKFGKIESFLLEGLLQFQYLLLGMSNRNPLFFSHPPFLRPK